VNEEDVMVSVRRIAVVGASAAVVMGGAGTAVLMTPFAGDTASAAESDNSGCSTGQLPGYVEGRPRALESGATAGTYVWHNSRGWDLAVTHPGDKTAVFTGTVHTSRPIEFVEVRDEANDSVTLSGDRMTMTYRFVNHGHIDGVRFRVDCARTVHFSVAADGKELSPAHVFLGTEGRRPSSNPFAVERR
jgi:hypothetical protein